jgi:hypothetical protein
MHPDPLDLLALLYQFGRRISWPFVSRRRVVSCQQTAFPPKRAEPLKTPSPGPSDASERHCPISVWRAPKPDSERFQWCSVRRTTCPSPIHRMLDPVAQIEVQPALHADATWHNSVSWASAPQRFLAFTFHPWSSTTTSMSPLWSVRRVLAPCWLSSSRVLSAG